MDALLQGMALVFTFKVLGVMLLAGMFGLFVGSIPGLTATMATALLVPMTFFMDPVPAIAAIVTAVAMAIFAGDIPGALLHVPGTPASAAYAADAYAMTRKGKAETALGAGLAASCIGGLFGTLVLVLVSQQLAEVALNFTSFEFFWLCCLGLSCAVFVSSANRLKGLVSLLIGLFIATVGIDILSGHPRFAFGEPQLFGGVSFIPAMIGMFAIAEVMRNFCDLSAPRPAALQHLREVFRGLGTLMLANRTGLARGSVIGTLIGALPGAGGDIAAWVSYAVSKRFSKTPEKYGTGHVEGIVDASAANNAALSGAWVPALVFGIPGDSITAIAIGVLQMKGMNPGPMIFLVNPQLIYGVFVAFFVANFALFFLGFGAIAAIRHVLRVPRALLWPIILMFCIVGAFAIDNALFGVGIMLVLGIVAFIMEENGFPIAPAILGMVIGRLLEENFITSMIKADGNPLNFFDRPIAAVLGVVTLSLWAAGAYLMLRARSRAAQVAEGAQ